MAAGLPVVSSDLPVFREYLVDGVDALMLPVGDDAALAAAMRGSSRTRNCATRLAEQRARPWRNATAGRRAPARHAEIYRGRRLTDVAR